jgi:hypothetical protein
LPDGKSTLSKKFWINRSGNDERSLVNTFNVTKTLLQPLPLGYSDPTAKNGAVVSIYNSGFSQKPDANSNAGG